MGSFRWVVIAALVLWCIIIGACMIASGCATSLELKAKSDPCRLNTGDACAPCSCRERVEP